MLWLVVSLCTLDPVPECVSRPWINEPFPTIEDCNASIHALKADPAFNRQIERVGPTRVRLECMTAETMRRNKITFDNSQREI